DRPEADERASTGRCKADRLATAVVGIATPLDQSALLQPVEQPDQLAAVEPQRVGDRRLHLPRALLEQREHTEVIRREPLLGELGDRPGLERIAEAPEQEDRAGDQL